MTRSPLPIHRYSNFFAEAPYSLLLSFLILPYLIFRKSLLLNFPLLPDLLSLPSVLYLL